MKKILFLFALTCIYSSVAQTSNYTSLRQFIEIEGRDCLEVSDLPFTDWDDETVCVDSLRRYNYYPTETLINYLCAIGYEGESEYYRCYILPEVRQANILLVNITRGDSDYSILVIVKNSDIVNHLLLGEYGGNDSLEFAISQTHVIKQRKCTRKFNLKHLESIIISEIEYQIQDDGKIIKIENK